MMLRQEGALDRSIDRKVTILLRLRKEITNLSIVSPSEDDGPRMENVEEVPNSDISSHRPRSVETVEDLKLKEQYGNVNENKGSVFSGPEQSGNLIENKGIYALKAGMLLKTKEVDGMS